MRRSLLALAVTLMSVLVLAGCGGDDGSPDAGPDDSLIPPESTELETTTTAPVETVPTTTGPTTTAPSTPTAFTAQAADAVNELKAAWEAGDQARARAIAPGDAVDALFAVPAGGFEVYGCDSGEFETSTCNLRNRATEAFIVVTAARSDAGWQIAAVDVGD